MELRCRPGVVVLSAALLGATAAGAQVTPAVERVEVRVALSDDGGRVDVVARFRLLSSADGDTLRLAAIPFFGLRAAELAATLDGAPVTVHGSIDRMPADARIALPPATSDAVELELRYTVPGAAVTGSRGTDLRIPVVLPLATAAGSGDDFFGVELAAPAAFTVIESFPSVAGLAGRSPGVLHAMRLPAAPSLLRWRLANGPARLTFARTVDLALAALLAVLALLGVRALRRPVGAS